MRTSILLLSMLAVLGLATTDSGSVEVMWTADCRTDFPIRGENGRNLKGAMEDSDTISMCGHGPFDLVYLVWDRDVDGIELFDCTRNLNGDTIVDSAFIGQGVFCATCSTGGFMKTFSWSTPDSLDTFYVVALNDTTLDLATHYGNTQDHNPQVWEVDGFQPSAEIRCTEDRSWPTDRPFEAVVFDGSSIGTGGLQPGTRKAGVARIAAVVPSGEIPWTSMRVDNGPSAGCTNDWLDIESVKIYREVAGAGFDPNDDLLIGEADWGPGPPDGGTATVTFSTPETLTTDSSFYYIAFDIASGATRENCVAACLQDSSYMGIPLFCMNGNFPFCSDDLGLPVEISRFDALPGDRLIILEWTTESEIDNKGFYIYRALSCNGEFSRVNEELIPGAGNSHMQIDYEYTDKDLENGTEYFYRLVSVTYGNALSTYEGIVSAVPSRDRWQTSTEDGLFGLSPNPFSSSSLVTYLIQAEGGRDVKLAVYDSSGRVLRVLLDGHAGPGLHTLEWDGRTESGSRAASGLYFCRLMCGGSVSVMKMVKVD
jgi:hypothetical protein